MQKRNAVWSLTLQFQTIHLSPWWGIPGGDLCAFGTMSPPEYPIVAGTKKPAIKMASKQT